MQGSITAITQHLVIAIRPHIPHGSGLASARGSLPDRRSCLASGSPHTANQNHTPQLTQSTTTTHLNSHSQPQPHTSTHTANHNHTAGSHQTSNQSLSGIDTAVSVQAFPVAIHRYPLHHSETSEIRLRHCIRANCMRWIHFDLSLAFTAPTCRPHFHSPFMLPPLSRPTHTAPHLCSPCMSAPPGRARRRAPAAAACAGWAMRRYVWPPPGAWWRHGATGPGAARGPQKWMPPAHPRVHARQVVGVHNATSAGCAE